MENGNRKDYWQYRAKFSYRYKGETFYTVTPVPLYYRRRKVLVDLLTKLIDETGATQICDFGCGDGWYLNYLAQRYQDKKLFGVDLSESMIERARQACPEADLQVSGDGILFEDKFDLIYGFAVFAHVMDDDKVESLFRNIANKIDSNGYFLIFEQVGPQRRQWDNFCRRTSDEYIEIASKCGFYPEKRTLIAFPAHRYFEKHFLPRYKRRFIKGSNIYERYFNANKSILLRTLSSIMVAVSGSPLRPDEGKMDGNVFIVFKKAEK